MNEPRHNPSRQPVRALGRRDPPSMNPENVISHILGSVVPTPAGGIGLDPEAFNGAPPWVLTFINSAQNCLAEVAALKYALLRRSLLTEVELQEAMVIMQQQVEAQFKTAVQSLERQLNQSPNDPRRSPG